MIVFDLRCRDDDTRFEGWFRSSEDFIQQSDGGLLMCPTCGGTAIEKAVMAPAVGRKGNQIMTVPKAETGPAQGSAPMAPSEPDTAAMPAATPLSPDMTRALNALAEMQKKVLEKSRWVGGKFAEEARAIHYGEQTAEPIHGETSREEAEELRDEGIEVAPLPFPVAPPKALN